MISLKPTVSRTLICPSETFKPNGKGGHSLTRRVLMCLIRIQTGIDVTTIGEQYFRTFDYWCKTEGKRHALLRAKAVYQHVLNYGLHQPSPETSFLSTYKEGFPKVLGREAKGLARRGPRELQALLGLTGFWRGVKAPGTPDISTIVDPSAVTSNRALESSIATFICKTWKFNVDDLREVNHVWRTRRGPNGQAIIASALDTLALIEDSTLLDNLKEFLDLSGFEQVLSDLEEFTDCGLAVDNSSQRPVHSRLSVKQELGGKDRIFAIVDYWTQLALKPLHSTLNQILRRIPQDATFDQTQGALKVKEWTSSNDELYSYDLSAATDRFPRTLITKVLENLTDDQDWSEAWLKVISDRTFKFGHRPTIKYSVGQPMGAYSSWPSFAIAHHCVVRYCAAKVKISKPKYTILGDDICIRSKLLATAYYETMTQLGVKISAAKTVTGPKVAEFAKRVFTHGCEVSPIPVKLVQSSITDFRLVDTLYQQIQEKAWGPIPLAPPILLNCYKGVFNPDVMTKAHNLLEIRLLLNSELTSTGSLRPLPSETKVTQGFGVTKYELGLLNYLIRYQYLMKGYERGMKSTDRFRSSIESLEIPGIGTGPREIHPLGKTLDFLRSSQGRAHKEIGRFWTQIQSYRPENLAKVPLPSKAIPDFGDLIPEFEKRRKAEAEVLLHTHTAFIKLSEVRKADMAAGRNPTKLMDFIKSL